MTRTERYLHITGSTSLPNGVKRWKQSPFALRLSHPEISDDPTGQIDETFTRQVNFDAIGLLLAIGKEYKINRFINASSSSVFGIKHESNVAEHLEPEPLTFYSKYKMLSEWLVIAASSPDFCTVNIRPATICGFSPRQRFDLVVNKLTADAVCKKIITVHGGEQRRPVVGMTDMINLYALLLEADPYLINRRTFNFGFENLKVIEIARFIQNELADLNVSVKVIDAIDRRDYHISSQKIIDALKYKPVSSLRREVSNLRKALESGRFLDIDDDKYYNMRCIKLCRDNRPYKFLSK